MDYGDRLALYRRAQRKWGDVSQMIVALEEFGEMVAVLSKHLNGKASVESVVDEMADVRIMLEQLESMLGCGIAFEDRMGFKLERLKKLVDGELPNPHERTVPDDESTG